jgi:hypothetical protein
LRYRKGALPEPNLANPVTDRTDEETPGGVVNEGETAAVAAEIETGAQIANVEVVPEDGAEIGFRNPTSHAPARPNPRWERFKASWGRWVSFCLA